MTLTNKITNSLFLVYDNYQSRNGTLWGEGIGESGGGREVTFFQKYRLYITGKNNGFPFLDILGYLKNTHKNPKFGRVRQVPIWELSWEFPGWDLSHFAKFAIFIGIL